MKLYNITALCGQSMPRMVTVDTRQLKSRLVPLYVVAPPAVTWLEIR